MSWNWLPLLLSLLNVVLGLMLAWLSWQQQRGSWRLMYVTIGLYWAGLYAYILASNVLGWHYDPGSFGQVWVRPAFTVTLAVMAAAAIWRRKKL